MSYRGPEPEFDLLQLVLAVMVLSVSYLGMTLFAPPNKDKPNPREENPVIEVVSREDS